MHDGINAILRKIWSICRHSWPVWAGASARRFGSRMRSAFLVREFVERG
jgi:hypothetical protein